MTTLTKKTGFLKETFEKERTLRTTEQVQSVKGQYGVKYKVTHPTRNWTVRL